MRGLIEKVVKPNDQRSFMYKPSFELLSYLGLSKIEDAPEYEKVKNEFEKINEQASKEEDALNNTSNDLDDEPQKIENTDNGNRNESSDARV
ncbi:MAG: hypothetical protein UT80_C0047G0004 [Parcubacteria group bacterium GW2011_GWC1_40_13]|nr:MAG: hypothetical protein UT80_C0047G0004 [Parcubacteria group bacterium GW2011_GWC1_40_13]